MLALTRRSGQSITVSIPAGGNIRIMVHPKRGRDVRVVLDMPDAAVALRDELLTDEQLAAVAQGKPLTRGRDSRNTFI